MRQKKYTAEELERAVEEYFGSISRTRAVTEDVWTGDLDKYGHRVMVPRTVTLDDGSPMTERQWIKPPLVGDLCLALGVHRSTWSNWAKAPEMAGVVEWANDVMHACLEHEAFTREGKNVRGVEFLLSANYGVSEKKTVEIAAPDLDMSVLSDEELKSIIAAGPVR